MASYSPTSSVFSPSQTYTSPYGDPSAHEIPRSYPAPPQYNNGNGAEHALSQPQPSQHQLHQASQLQTAPQHQRNQASTSSDSKARLRKACDSCSVRKVKCDESGPPCKSCAALDIPCTFERPSRRRGPPNKHAEAIKRQKLDETGSYTSSPTHDAAWSLAALAAPTPFSAEAICDITSLQILIDDYFTYIHPLVPIPHEPTFRAAFARRDDLRDRSFLALLAAMLEALVASFPRRPRQLFTSEEARMRYPNAGALMDKCHQIYNEARGAGFLDRDLNLYDACGSYLVGLSAGYTFDMPRIKLYFGECVMILRQLGYHKPGSKQEQAGENPNFINSDPTREQGRSYIEQECGRRLFWLCFVGCLSMRQLGGTDGDLLMPPLSHSEKLPPLPLEIDDDYIFDTYIGSQPAGVISALSGFNLNVRVFRAFHALTALEMAFGANEIYDWDRQRRVIRQALSNVKAATEKAPTELQLHPVGPDQAWPPLADSPSAYTHLLNGRHDPMADPVGLPSRNRANSDSLPYPRRAVQYEIQKANIYASQLATRSYLVEKYWNLYELKEARVIPPERPPSAVTTSPTVGALAAGFDHNYSAWQSGRTPSDGMDAGEQAMAVERENIVRDLAVLLRSINQVNMEPNGLSFCHKIRQVASTLLETQRARMSVMPTLDSEEVNAYLLGFLDILAKLERLGSGRIRSNMGNMYDAHGNTIPGGHSAEEIEEEELVHWASLKEHQERFVRANGFVDV